MQRGIILGTEPFDAGPTFESVPVRTVDDVALRRALLYWDRIAIPVTSEWFFMVAPDADFLEAEGLLTKVDIFQRVKRDTDWIVGQPAIVHGMLEESEPGQWTIGADHSYRYGPKLEAVERAVVELNINNALPVPPGDEPLQEILELRAKRRDELVSFRIAVDEIVEAALRNSSLPRGEWAATHRLQAAIRDVVKVANPNWISRTKSMISFDFKAGTASAGAFAGVGATTMLGLPGLQIPAAIVGALTSSIKFEMKVAQISAAIPESSKNFAYLYHVEKALPGTLARRSES